MNYDTVALSDVCEFLDSQRVPITESDRKPGPYPYYGANGQQDSIDNYIFDEPLVLLAEDGGYFGSKDRPIAYKVTGKCWVNNHAHVLRPKSNIDVDYLHRVLSYCDVTKYVNGTTRQKLTKGNAENISFPLPPLTEQKRIASLLARADRVRRLRRTAHNLGDALLQSVFLEMFGDPIENTKHWQCYELGEIASIERGRFSPRPRNDPKYYGGKYPFIQTGDISSSGGVVTEYSQTLNEHGIKVSKAFDIGTIVIAIVGATIGESAILGIRTYCPDSIIGITPHPKNCNSQYLDFVMRHWKPVFRAQAPETARANINIGIVKPIPIPVPPLSLQEEFASVVARVESLRGRMAEIDRQVEGLFESLLSESFGG